MVKNLFVSAICAGIAAGLLASVLQFTFVIPVLLEGELYETGARVHFTGAWQRYGFHEDGFWSAHRLCSQLLGRDAWAA